MRLRLRSWISSAGGHDLCVLSHVLGEAGAPPADPSISRPVSPAERDARSQRRIFRSGAVRSIAVGAHVRSRDTIDTACMRRAGADRSYTERYIPTAVNSSPKEPPSPWKRAWLSLGAKVTDCLSEGDRARKVLREVCTAQGIGGTRCLVEHDVRAPCVAWCDERKNLPFC